MKKMCACCDSLCVICTESKIICPDPVALCGKLQPVFYEHETCHMCEPVWIRNCYCYFFQLEETATRKTTGVQRVSERVLRFVH